MRQLLNILAICGLLATMAAPSFGQWTVIDLGTLYPTEASEGTGISDDGAYVTGWSASAPFRFNDANGNFQVDAGEMIDLQAAGQPLDGHSNTVANAVNSSGSVVGRTDVPTDIAFRTVPAYIGGANTNLSGINEAGIAAGGSNAEKTAYVLELDNTWTPLPSVAGKWTSAFDINDNNMVCGMDDNGAGTRQGTVWDHDGTNWVKTILPALGGNTEGEAWGLNDNGQVVGINRIGDRYAVLWEDTGSGWTITELDAIGSYAYDINNAGVAVGKRGGDGRIWTPDGSGGYDVSDINSLVAGSGWNIRVGTGISDQGWIVGQGNYEGGQWHAVLIAEVPEPSLAVMILGGLLLGLIAFRRR